MKNKLTRNRIEEDSSQCLKILSSYTVKKTKIDWQRFEMFDLWPARFALGP